MGLCNILVFRIIPIMLKPIMLKLIMLNETYYVEIPIMLKPIMFNELHKLLCLHWLKSIECNNEVNQYGGHTLQ